MFVLIVLIKYNNQFKIFIYNEKQQHIKQQQQNAKFY